MVRRHALLVLLCSIVGCTHRWLPSVPENAGRRPATQTCASFSHDNGVFVECAIEVARELAARGEVVQAYDVLGEAARGRVGAPATTLNEARALLRTWLPEAWRDVERLVDEGRHDLALRRGAALCNAFAASSTQMRRIQHPPLQTCPKGERLAELQRRLFDAHTRMAKRMLARAPGAAAVHACWARPSGKLCKEAKRRHFERAYHADVEVEAVANPGCEMVADAAKRRLERRVHAPLRRERVDIVFDHCGVHDETTTAKTTCFHVPGQRQGTLRRDLQLEAVPAVETRLSRRLVMRGWLRTTTDGVEAPRIPFEIASELSERHAHAPTCEARSLGRLPDRGVDERTRKATVDRLIAHLYDRVNTLIEPAERKRHIAATRASTAREADSVAEEDLMTLELVDHRGRADLRAPHHITNYFLRRYGFFRGTGAFPATVHELGLVLPFGGLRERGFAASPEHRLF